MPNENVKLSRRTMLMAGAASIPLISIPLYRARADGLEGVELSQYKPVFFTPAE